MKIRFEEEEYFPMAMFQKGSRKETIQEICKVISLVDGEMVSLINRTLEKLEHLSDVEFQALELEAYLQEPAEEDL